MTNTVTGQKVTCWHTGYCCHHCHDHFSLHNCYHSVFTNVTQLFTYGIYPTIQLWHQQSPDTMTYNTLSLQAFLVDTQHQNILLQAYQLHLIPCHHLSHLSNPTHYRSNLWVTTATPFLFYNIRPNQTKHSTPGLPATLMPHCQHQHLHNSTCYGHSLAVHSYSWCNIWLEWNWMFHYRSASYT